MIRRSTWILLAIFILVLVIAIIIQRSQEQSQVEATPAIGVTYLFDVQDTQIIALEIDSADGRKLVVQRGSDGNWALIEPEYNESDVNRIESVITQAESLRILSKLDTHLDLDVLGLDQPSYWIVVTTAEGQQQMAYIGSVTPTGSGYYAFLSGGPIQIVNKLSVDSVLEILDDPPVLAATATPGQ